ncbi:MAG: metallophosphoesterase family protein, partial [Clostridia bacterium]|nr:metallophosphoesterase family protein [Clostridia bacterium]
MRIGVFSDSHGDTQALDELLDKMGYLDAICFLGDIARDAFHLKDRADAMPNHPQFFAVRGNNDFACRLPVDLLVDLGGVPVYMTHGHTVVSLMSLAYRAQEKGAKI